MIIAKGIKEINSEYIANMNKMNNKKDNQNKFIFNKEGMKIMSKEYITENCEIGKVVNNEITSIFCKNGYNLTIENKCERIVYDK